MHYGVRVMNYDLHTCGGREFFLTFTPGQALCARGYEKKSSYCHFLHPKLFFFFKIGLHFCTNDIRLHYPSSKEELCFFAVGNINLVSWWHLRASLKTTKIDAMLVHYLPTF